MKAKVFILALLIAAGFSMVSCTSSKSGCKSTEGYVGYGHR